MPSNNIATADELRVYFSRVKPLYRELFNMAHAICGNYELAEYALQRAILECYQKIGKLKSRVGFRENLRATLRRFAFEQAQLLDDAELTWDGFKQDAIDGAQGDFILQMASAELVDVRRMLMLRYGCGLKVGQIAKLMHVPAGQVSSTLNRFEKRVQKRLAPRERSKVESRLNQAARAQLTYQTEGVPDAGTVYRSFEAEAVQPGTGGGRAYKIFSNILMGLLILLCAAVFWVAMVLLQTPEMESPSQNVQAEFAPQVELLQEEYLDI